MEKMYCYDCDKEVKPLKKKVKEHYDFREKEFDVTLDLFYCPLCSGEIANEKELNFELVKMWNAYLKCDNLSLKSFKEIRLSYNLSQELFAKALGWNRRSIIRYENNDEIPRGEYLNTYVKLHDNPDYLWECLYKNSLNEEDYNKIINKLQLKLSIKARNAIIYILKDNPLYVLQFNKNMFAVDFLNYKNNKESLTGFKYVKMKLGPVVDNYKDILNKMLKTGEIKIANTNIIEETESFKYIANWDVSPNIFTKEELAILKKVKEKFKNKTGKFLSDWSHKFKGWEETPQAQIISYEKYSQYFNL